MPRNCSTGFTLSELLISFAILGVIATFTIPKVLQSQINSKYKTVGKESIAMISGAYAAYKLEKGLPESGTFPLAFRQYMNYVKIDTVTSIDTRYNSAVAQTCAGAGSPCIQLHNGAMLQFGNWASFGGTGSTNAVTFFLDPDGKVTDGTTNGPGNSLQIWLYYSGRISTTAKADPGTTGSNGTFSPIPTADPPWFSWE